MIIFVEIKKENEECGKLGFGFVFNRYFAQ